MFTIKTLNEIDKQGLDKFSDNYVIEDNDQADGIVLRSFKMHDYPLNDNLKAIARAGAGVNNVPVDKCSEKGIVVFNTPGANANGVKELVIAGLLMSSRDIAGSIDWAKTLVGKGDEVPKLVESGKKAFGGPEIKGKTLGVIGLGAIGVIVANAASALGMNVLGYDPYISVAAAWGLSRNVKRADSYEELFAASDYITMHMPLLPDTTKFINEQRIAQMKDGVRILNFSRGELVDDDAIEVALKSGKVSKYVTDFPNAKTVGMENVIAIPHLGASTPESEVNCAIMAVEQIRDYLENGNIRNSVNYPDCDLGICRTAARVTINHKNIPNMVGQITAIMGTQNLNIADMINKSRKEWAYTVLDVEGNVTDEMVKALSDIEGIVKVRVFKKEV